MDGQTLLAALTGLSQQTSSSGTRLSRQLMISYAPRCTVASGGVRASASPSRTLAHRPASRSLGASYSAQELEDLAMCFEGAEGACPSTYAVFNMC